MAHDTFRVITVEHMATPPNSVYPDAPYLHTWEYIFFPERFEAQEIQRRYGQQPQQQRIPEVARTYIQMPIVPRDDAGSRREP